MIMIIILNIKLFFMSIFKRKFIKEKMIINRGTVRNSLISCAFLLSTTAGEVLAKDKNYVAVEPLTCDLVKAISPSPTTIESNSGNCAASSGKAIG